VLGLVLKLVLVLVIGPYGSANCRPLFYFEAVADSPIEALDLMVAWWDVKNG
jgi:hypothetical protein